MPARPNILLGVGGPVQAGELLGVRVTLESSSDTRVASVDLALEATELLLANEYGGQESATVWTAIASRRLAQEKTLVRGVKRYTARLRVPEGAPPTHRGALLLVEYRLHVHVDIPWWPDAHAYQPVEVILPRDKRPRARPLHWVSPPRPGEPMLELCLDDAALAPGDTISGSLTYGGLGGRRVDAASMSLVGEERVWRRGVRHDGTLRRELVFVSVANHVEGRPEAFAARIPEDVPAETSRLVAHSQAARGEGVERAELVWHLEVRTDVPWGADLVHRIPIRVGNFPARVAKRATGAPRIGLERWRELWQAAGDRYAMRLDASALRLTTHLRECELIVELDDTRHKGLVGSLSWQPWGFGLAVERKRLGHAGELRFEDHPEFDVFAVDASLPERARWVLTRRVRSVLLAMRDVELDDAGARATSPGSPRDREALDNLLVRLVQLADAVSDAVARMPAPPTMLGQVLAWRELAAATGGKLFVGNMSIVGGRLDDAGFELHSTLDDQSVPTATRLVLHLSRPLAEDDLARAETSALREIRSGLERDGRRVAIHEQRLELVFQPALIDLAEVRPSASALRLLERRLRGEHGPRGYR